MKIKNWNVQILQFPSCSLNSCTGRSKVRFSIVCIIIKDCIFSRYSVTLGVRSKGFQRINRKQKLFFITKTHLIDQSLMNLGNYFHQAETNDLIIYWIGLDKILISEKDTIDIQYADAHGLAM